MYAIISGGVLLALCDKPRYVKMNEASGAYVEAEEAQEERLAAVEDALCELDSGMNGGEN